MPFSDAYGNTYTNGDPFDRCDVHTLRYPAYALDAPGVSRMTCPVCHKHIHSTADHVFHCEYWNHGRLCHQYVHHDCARSYRGDSMPLPRTLARGQLRPYDGKSWYDSAFTFVDGTLKTEAHDTEPPPSWPDTAVTVRCAVEYHTHPLTMADVDNLTDIAGDTPTVASLASAGVTE